MKKIICIILIGASLFLFINGCSTVKNLFGWMKFWNSDTKITKPTDKDIARFASAMRARPGNPNSHYLLACNYQNQGKHKEAIKEFNKVILIDPKNAKAYNGMGISYDMVKNFANAVGAYKKALAINPKLDYVYNNLGYSYLLQKKFDEAIISFKNAIALNENEKQFHDNLGLAYAEKGEFESAMNEFKLAGDEAKANYNLAQIYHKKGLYETAQKHYEASLSADPSFMPAKIGLESVNSMLRIFKADAPVPLPLSDAKAETMTSVSQPVAVLEKGKTEKAITSVQLPVAKVDKAEIKSVKEVAVNEMEKSESKSENSNEVIHVVKRGDTLWGIAREYKVSIKSIKEWNSLEKTSSIKLNQKIKIYPLEVTDEEIAIAQNPAPVVNAKIEAAAPVILPVAKKAEEEKVITSVQPPVAKVDKAEIKSVKEVAMNEMEKSESKSENSNEVIHVVKRGDTLWGIAREYGVSVKSIKEWNSIGETSSIKLNQKIKIHSSEATDEEIIAAQKPAPVVNAKEEAANKTAGIEISNGNGVRHMARMVGKSLKGKGHNVVRITNANNFKHAKTDIYYQRGYKREAVRLARQLPVFQYLKESKKFGRANVKVKVLIGKDLIQYSKSFNRENFADNSSKVVK